MLEISEKTIHGRKQEHANSQKLLEQISIARKDQISTYFNNDPKITELEKRFGKYLFVPLALPIFELPDQQHFLSWWSTHQQVVSKIKEDIVVKEYGFKGFESVDILNKFNEEWESNNQTTSFVKEFPKLYQQFFDQLPCKELMRITMWSSIRDIPEHRDNAEFIDLPGSFRIKLYDENPSESLYIFENTLAPYNNYPAQALPTLTRTNSFVWNNLRTKHGSIYNPQYKKIIALIIGLVDIEKYEALLTTSINTFGSQCIISNNSITNYVNI
jgi:hypothetical protein